MLVMTECSCPFVGIGIEAVKEMGFWAGASSMGAVLKFQLKTDGKYK